MCTCPSTADIIRYPNDAMSVLCHVFAIIRSSVMPSLPGFDEGKRKEDETGEGSRYCT